MVLASEFDRKSMSIAVNWFEIPVKDEARAKAFMKQYWAPRCRQCQMGLQRCLHLWVTMAHPGVLPLRTPALWPGVYWCI